MTTTEEIPKKLTAKGRRPGSGGRRPGAGRPSLYPIRRVVKLHFRDEDEYQRYKKIPVRKRVLLVLNPAERVLYNPEGEFETRSAKLPFKDEAEYGRYMDHSLRQRVALPLAQVN